MSDLYVVGQTTSKSRVGNGQTVRVTGTREGAIYVADYVLQAALEGRIFETSAGSASTVAVFKATASYAAAQPELAIDVPSGTTIIPVRILISLENSAGTDNEAWALTSTGAVGAGTSTALTIRNARTDDPVTSGCSAYSVYSGNGTAPTATREFWRRMNAFADANTMPERYWEWEIQRGTPQVIVGPGSLVVYVLGAATAPEGFIKASWIELPSSSL